MAAAWRTFLFLLVLGIAPAHAQDPGTLNQEPLPPLQDFDSPKIPAKELFARKTTPLPGPPQSIGPYADGCLAGAIALPTTGSSWQVMRVSRNRYWGNPSLLPGAKLSGLGLCAESADGRKTARSSGIEVDGGRTV